MAVIKGFSRNHSGAAPGLSQLAAACRAALGKPAAVAAPPFSGKTYRRAPAASRPSARSSVLQAFCLSALALPGLADQGQAGGNMPSSAQGGVTLDGQTDAETDSGGQTQTNGDDEVGYQYSHYEEGKRNFWTVAPSIDNGAGQNATPGLGKFANTYNPITVDSEHAFTRFRLGDRSRFAFNYAQDVWSGATPWFTAPAGLIFGVGSLSPGRASASYDLYQSRQGFFFDAQGKPLYVAAERQSNLSQMQLAPNVLQHVMGYASPEMRNQADFKLGYDWDNAAVDIGGGASIERDYLSRFGNLATRLDFNQKLTTLNLGLSYTNSDTHATLNPDEAAYFVAVNQPDANISRIAMMHMPGMTMTETLITGNRQDGAVTLALSQILNKNAVVNTGFAYTHSSGYLSNPYKQVMDFQLDPNWRTDGFAPGAILPANAYPGVQHSVNDVPLLEQRPGLRNQFNWDAGYRQFVEPLNAAAQLNYSFFHDDWGVNAHTFGGEWRQALGSSWSLTPHARYYSQSGAFFYTPYVLQNVNPGQASSHASYASLAGSYFSSDQRLSSYGAISGGITLAKQFARGLTMELGYEYYTHKGGLALDGGGTPDYADFHYFVANASLRANLGLLAKAGGGYDSGSVTGWLDGLFEDSPSQAAGQAGHRHRHGQAAAPAGVMFAHMLDRAGDYMLGYRFMHNNQGGGYLYGQQPVSSAETLKLGCPGLVKHATNCNMLSTSMTMNMHMLDLMYAPSDWLTLMLMPQFMSMDMNMQMFTGKASMSFKPDRDYQASGGFGDTGAYALLRLWDGANQHVHISQGISAPTGSVNILSEYETRGLYPYGLQVGSGTWDYKPSLTYTGRIDDWFWGGQVSGTHRLQAENSYGYRLGDVFQSTAWGGYQLTDWLSATVRGLYTGQGKIVGGHDLIGVEPDMYMPETAAANYGGSFGDVGVGFSAAARHGRLAGHVVNFEWLQPVYTNVQGYQLDRTGALAASWAYHF